MVREPLNLADIDCVWGAHFAVLLEQTGLWLLAMGGARTDGGTARNAVRKMPLKQK
ncbi:hypothetical protein [Mycolicibacterium aubagnense]|uniref:Uncharacterized protein n=1 Tax=Mycolicibacterium aubagnense TaxID=319707 RepID=A0ABN5YVF8_9MYCO|nr:hypothetical protein [Mycolicibacterium aubagnense]WGI32606.1 hypothetical protein QDT91_26160 [Mycolicibacterium aubagnense]BBX85802.1 hypothetical protein MAUB_36750 [Mycolicibacterium aubagnense]